MRSFILKSGRAEWLLIVFIACFSLSAYGASDLDGWLRYAPLDPQIAKRYQDLPSTIVVLGDSAVLKSAESELLSGIPKMTGRPLVASITIRDPTIVLATSQQAQALVPQPHPPHETTGDGYSITEVEIHGASCLLIAGNSERGVLYGAFALLRKIAQGESLEHINAAEHPAARIRWIDQWDNPDGSVERGYGGRSIFFDKGKVRDDLTRAEEYARLLASIGITTCTVNNVNAAPQVLDGAFIPQLKRIADVFRPWGVLLSLSVDLSSPKVIGGLDTFDPLDEHVANWWKEKADEIYREIPDFAGFVVKADSEGRSGPSAYGRTHADAANVIARALRSHGGVVFYRAFVYNHHLDWRNLKNDRAKAAYENFHPLDGKFDRNVIVQVKNGPIDFQVREPASPLFGDLQSTNKAIELQITQEYTGQQKQLCFLVPMWKEVLDFDMHLPGRASQVKDIVSQSTPATPLNGFVGVANVGLDENWMGSPLAMANLYGFGRLAWDPNLSAEKIVDEWTRLTFGNDPLVVQTISKLQLDSWPVYESYTGPLGAGTLTNITGNHYDPAPESSEENGWGQWHRADHQGIGMDRTVATGTGYIGQYPPAVQKMYESLAACPDNLLLFFHHVPWTYVLHSGKTVIQHIYDTHYEGAERAQQFIARWQALRGHVDQARYRDILARFEFQAGEAVKWRDTICEWAYRMSGIPDQKGRVGTPAK
ncbi:MAG TPA: alpha-glucuronidase family glycosyl hydrolase [Candidatus Sulfotelmatobacter sp.]|nr:alpha-glucuronidase family glycosyl hydrolase [Candidatus Sulfotelmatobacter sp.]